jgi:hypothetical protein
MSVPSTSPESSLRLPFLVPVCFERPLREPRIVRRRANMQQGKALEILGHAIEYLVDSRMFLVGDPGMLLEAHAVRVLSRCSRELFASCTEVVPVGVRLRDWMSAYLGGSGSRAHARRG